MSRTVLYGKQIQLFQDVDHSEKKFSFDIDYSAHFFYTACLSVDLFFMHFGIAKVNRNISILTDDPSITNRKSSSIAIEKYPFFRILIVLGCCVSRNKRSSRASFRFFHCLNSCEKTVPNEWKRCLSFNLPVS